MGGQNCKEVVPGGYECEEPYFMVSHELHNFFLLCD